MEQRKLFDWFLIVVIPPMAVDVVVFSAAGAMLGDARQEVQSQK